MCIDIKLMQKPSLVTNIKTNSILDREQRLYNWNKAWPWSCKTEGSNCFRFSFINHKLKKKASLQEVNLIYITNTVSLSKTKLVIFICCLISQSWLWCWVIMSHVQISLGVSNQTADLGII